MTTSFYKSAMSGTQDIYAFEESSAWQIAYRFDRVLKGEPELDYLQRHASDYLFENMPKTDRDPDMIRAALQLVLQASHAEANMQVWEREKVNLPLGAEIQEFYHYALPGQATQAWMNGFYHGLICRSDKQIEHLNFLPYTRHFVKDEVLGEFELIYYHFLRNLGHDMSRTFLTRAAYALDKIPHDYARQHRAYFPLWAPVIQNNQAGMEATLSHVLYERERLLSHRMRREADIAIMAILSFAYDKGMEVDAKRYPQFSEWVEGRFLVDLETKLPTHFPPQPPRIQKVG